MPPRGRSSATPGPKPVPEAPPAVRNGIDTRYGSEGRANLTAQLTTGRASETLGHFTRAGTRSQSVRQASIVSQQAPPRESSSPRPDTALDHVAGYDASQLQQQQAPLPRGAPAAPRAATPVRAAVAVEEEVEEAALPGAFAVFMHTLPRYLPQVLQDAEQTATQLCLSLAVIALLLAGVFGTLLVVAAVTPLPAGIALRRDTVYDCLKAAVGRTGTVSGLETFKDFTASPEWEKFLAENTEKLEARLRDIPEHPYPINRFEFESTLAANNQMHRDDMRVQLEKFKELVMREAQEMLAEGNSATLKRANKILADSPELKIGMGHLDTHALTTALYERHRLMTQVNFFSPGLGALVHPHFTSKTASPNRKSWLTWWYMTQEVTSAPPHPPVVALMSWQEGTECWCAQHSEGSKAELTVQLGQTIIPQTIYIEHIPASGTMDISAAPKKIAVWAQMDSVAEAQRIRAHQEREWREIGYDWELSDCGEAPKGQKDWVCIRTAEYDIHFPAHVQDWALYRRGAATVKTKRISVRVTENWGAPDHTCLYRVRVTGDLADAEGLMFIDDEY